MKFDIPSPASSVRTVTGQNAEPAICSRTKFMALAFWRIARSTRIRCVAKKFSTPCCTHPDSKETNDDSRAWAVVGSGLIALGMMTSVLLHRSINLNLVFLGLLVNLKVQLFCDATRRRPVGSGKVIIKKYANRRLYDTSGSRYINLEDIAALVRNGKDLQVVDAKTGEDLTRVTLTQIIVEDAKEQPTGLPLELLRQLIVASDRVGQEFIMWYLKSAFDAYKKVQNTLESRLTDVQSVALSPLQMMKKFIPGSATETASEPGTELQELQKLRKRLAEMEARHPEKPKRPKKRRRASA